jgi:DnaD/phage-associated family protein
MPKYRQLHTKIINSFDFAEMPDDFTRVVWILLAVIVDSEGRGIYSMQWVKSKMFPLRQDVPLDRLQDAFTWLSNRNMISIYSVNNREYFYIPTFKKYQSGTIKEAASLLPEPTNNSIVTPELLQSKEGTTTDKVCAAVVVIESESVLGSDIGSVFKVYEKEIGIISEAVKEKILEAEKIYPVEWMVDAMKESAIKNKRFWGYTEGVLKKWKVEGRGNGNGNSHKHTDPDAHSVYAGLKAKLDEQQ